MRIFAIILLLTLSSEASGQYKVLLAENFFGRQPSARAEAMGKAYTSIDGDLGTVYFNPAGIASLNGVAISGSYTPPSFYMTEGYYTYFGAGVKLTPYLRFAFTQFQFNYGNTILAVPGNTPFSKRNTLTIASEPFKNFYIGVNANYIVYETGVIGKESSFYIDFGAIKKFDFWQNESTGHSASLGASISNFTLSTMTFGKDNSYRPVDELPVIGRVGVNYQFNFKKDVLIQNLQILRFLAQGEYRNVLNDDLRTAYRAGGEILLCEILALRMGYYKETVDNMSLPDENYDEIIAITAGFGLQLPLNNLTKLPVIISFDYTSLPQQPYSELYTDFENFTTYSLRINWLFKKMEAESL